MILLEAILGFIVESIIFTFLCYILSPIVWIASLPFILIIALFRRGNYDANVNEMLTSVNFFWRWGMGLRN